MLLREQYQEHSERDYLSVPLATYHFEQVTIPLHWHREVELILPEEAGELELLKLLETYHSHGLLVERGPRASEPHTQAVKESIAYMRRNLDQELSLERLADQAALSPSHYIRVFRRYTGQTPFAFLSDLRLREAAHCLEQGMTVSETALHVGLGNLSYFIRLFRQRYGQTPKQYQLGLTSRKK